MPVPFGMAASFPGRLALRPPSYRIPLPPTIPRRQLKLDADPLQRGRIAQAILELNKAIALHPQSAAGHMLLGQAYLATRLAGLIAEAKAELRQALDLDPGLEFPKSCGRCRFVGFQEPLVGAENSHIITTC